MANYVLLERIELNASAASVTFSNIPQSGYTDLKVVISGRSTSWGYSYNNLYLSMNGSPSGSAHSDRILYSVGTSAGSLSESSVTKILIAATPSTAGTANTFSNTEVYIPNYTSSNYKSVSVDGVAERNSGTNGDVFLSLTAGLWASTSAITSLVFTTDVTSFEQYTTFSLYGLAAVGTTPAIAPKATGGNLVTTDGTYWYHAFTSSGTFTPLAGLTCDYLVVAGGGSGGTYGGGGGAGGLRSTVTATGGGGSLESAVSMLGNAPYTVTVGAGGANAASDAAYGNDGNNSSISGTGITTITSIGGGGGAGTGFNTNGRSGGSGGGGSGSYGGGTGTGGARTVNQGFIGGSTSGGNLSDPSGSGGGGGAGAVGGSAAGTGRTGGAGGSGVAISAFATATGTGVSNYYAGGGGGNGNAGGSVGAGGAGGGGAGGKDGRSESPAATPGTANTGGGGGGTWYAGASTTAGGSGIVIVRYAV